MRKILSKCIMPAIVVGLLLVLAVPAGAAETVPSLSGLIKSAERRHFVEAMLSYHLQENMAVRDTLEAGHTALFFFEGCSDNMEDPQLRDISYYRVSAVCIGLKLNDSGKPEIIYFNDDCSTLPDRPHEIGSWELEEVGAVGPATVCDGTYELYSVYHAGSYEALHLRTSYEDETVAAVYFTKDGFVTSRATYINIHTRNCNHALQEAMWSAGCLLVGDGDFSDFAELIAAAYYSDYDWFLVDQRVGTVTVNRLYLQEELYALYENDAAVDTILVSSRCESPEIYLQRCSESQPLAETKTVQAAENTSIMSLPCGNDTDSRSIAMTMLEKGDRVDICGSIVNTRGDLWYEVELFNVNGYVPSGDVEDIPEPWYKRLFSWLGGKE